MKLSTFILSSAVAIAASGTAFAQGQGPTGGQHIHEACAADFQQFCPNAQTREDRHACLQSNQDKLSDSCKSALAAMHPHGDQNSSQNHGGSSY